MREIWAASGHVCNLSLALREMSPQRLRLTLRGPGHGDLSFSFVIFRLLVWLPTYLLLLLILSSMLFLHLLFLSLKVWFSFHIWGALLNLILRVSFRHGMPLSIYGLWCFMFVAWCCSTLPKNLIQQTLGMTDLSSVPAAPFSFEFHFAALLALSCAEPHMFCLWVCVLSAECLDCLDCLFTLVCLSSVLSVTCIV